MNTNAKAVLRETFERMKARRGKTPVQSVLHPGEQAERGQTKKAPTMNREGGA